MESSQNLFVRLKRYQIAGNNPRENHATEVLAGCLDLSLDFRREFLDLIGEHAATPEEIDSWRIETQVYIPAGSDGRRDSYLDLVLRNGAGRFVAIEVKVDAPLLPEQIAKYLSFIGSSPP